MDKPIVIEGVGIFGLGKTTVLGQLVKHLQSAGYTVLTNDDFQSQQPARWYRWIVYSLSYRTWLFVILRLYNYCLGKSDFMRFDQSFRDWFGPSKQVIDRRRFVKKNTHADYIIFDEATVMNTVHNCWKNSLPQWSFKYFLHSSAYADVTHYIFFQSDVELSIRRTKYRAGDAFIDHMSDNFRRQFIPLVAGYVVQIEQYLDINFPQQTLKLNSDESVGKKLTKVYAYTQSLRQL